jgi:transcriptional regulator with XRE-family HTH domain
MNTTNRRLELLARQSQLLQELQSVGAELLALELAPQPEPKPEFVEPALNKALEKRQQKATAAKAGTTVATVRKVEKARKGKNIVSMSSADLRKLAKELGVATDSVNFRKKEDKENLRERLTRIAEGSTVSVGWSGLSANRQQQLAKAAAPNTSH